MEYRVCSHFQYQAKIFSFVSNSNKRQQQEIGLNGFNLKVAPLNSLVCVLYDLDCVTENLDSTSNQPLLFSTFFSSHFHWSSVSHLENRELTQMLCEVLSSYEILWLCNYRDWIMVKEKFQLTFPYISHKSIRISFVIHCLLFSCILHRNFI